MSPFRIKQIVTSLAVNVENEISKVKIAAKTKEKTRMQKIAELVETGKFKPEVSCLCAEMDLTPE